MLKKILKKKNKSYNDLHTKKEMVTVSYIDFPYLMEKSTEGSIRIKTHGECAINIYNGEGNKPHFHIESSDKENKWVCCIRLDTPKYFKHGEEKQGILSNYEIRKLIKILNSKSSGDPSLTVFETLCIIWNSDLNNTSKIKKPYKIPDYNKLNEKG